VTCQHPAAEPVDVAGETVAQVCTSCLEQLPANWGCGDCEWIEEREFWSPAPILYTGRPCPAHR
jgi:hypothetical protein